MRGDDVIAFDTGPKMGRGGARDAFFFRKSTTKEMKISAKM